ncbi:hypothetical protein Hte_000376 [Hypoxylon texense]
MEQSLQNTISKGWPPMSRDATTPMTIQANHPEKLFEKASSWVSQIRATILNDDQQYFVNQQVREATARAIYGSNMIEDVGLSLRSTVYACGLILAGKDVGEDELQWLPPNAPEPKKMWIIPGIREVVQHAKAFQHIIYAFVAEKQDLTEDLIKETHRILTRGIPISQRDGSEVPPEEYGGIYRTVVVGAGSADFTVPKFVPVQVKRMCDNLKEELAAAEEKKTIDPFSIAAKYSLQFVHIHPFQDGNGRVCRMILNAILCRYAGVIVPIGEEEEEREEYMSIERRSSETMGGHGEYAVFVLRRAYPHIRDLRVKLAVKGKGKVVRKRKGMWAGNF